MWVIFVPQITTTKIQMAGMMSPLKTAEPAAVATPAENPSTSW